MTIQHLPVDVAILPYRLQRKRKLKWLMLCSWQKQETKYFLLPSSSPRCCLERLLKIHDDKLIIWKSVSLKPDIPLSIESLAFDDNRRLSIDSLKLLPAKDQEIVDSMKRRYAKRVIWKQLEDNGIQ